MTDFKEEAYVLEKMEISEDEDDGFEYKEIKDEDDLIAEEQDELEVSAALEEDDDLNDFAALKTNTEKRKIAQQVADGDKRGVRVAEAYPKTVTQEVVIDDFIRNFMQKFKMEKTLNIFHQEWHELQKKGTFHDVQIGLITDSKNKNDKLRAKIEKMKVELKEANVIADQAKSTWEKLRKERDFHRTHQDRVNGEKVTIAQNIKRMRDLHEEYEEKIEEIQKKHLAVVKEKALIKLEKDKMQKRCTEI